MNLKLSRYTKIALVLVSFVVVAFGQPARSPFLGLVTSAIGFALIWRVLISISSARRRFYVSCAWFYAVQLVQFSWFVTHPYLYIWAVYLIGPLVLYAIPFGLISSFIKPKYILDKKYIFFIPALWTVVEWLRIFFLSGCSWNPTGLAMTCHIYPLQMASLFGVFGLTFWVMCVNFLALRAWIQGFTFKSTLVWALLALFPYLYGAVHIGWHAHKMQQREFEFKALLVQPGFPAEETLGICSQKRFTEFVFDEWKQIFSILEKHQSQKVDLIVLPEVVVPFGVYSLAFPYLEVSQSLKSSFGESVDKDLPVVKEPYARLVSNDGVQTLMVNNAYILQALSNIFDASLVVGLEDVEQINADEREYYSAALYFTPHNIEHDFSSDRYAKRILVPMGEYIPFKFCEELAKKYGVYGSFVSGENAKVWSCQGVPFGVSICYEETFGDLMRENRENGAELLVNLTSDVWYPNSSLPRQHFDHSRLRTVEMGIPLIRACNTGITSACDSLGRVVNILGKTPHEHEWMSDALFVSIPVYSYQTLYMHLGDGLILGFSFFFIVFFLKDRPFKP